MKPALRVLAPLLALALLGPSGAVASPDAGARPEQGTVLTFYGLRRLEQDPNVSDAEKVKEWAAFVERAKKQIAYAEKAMERWQEAAKLRLVETARLTERDEAFTPRQRMARWEAVEKAYPGTPEARRAEERADYWRDEETARLVREAEVVETQGRSKVERIAAWAAVRDWRPQSRAARAAARRIAALQKQLFVEAESVDEIERLDDATKLEAWRDVLRGDPSPAQKKKAEQRVAELSP